MLILVSSFIVLSVVNKTKQIFLLLFSFTLTHSHRENRASCVMMSVCLFIQPFGGALAEALTLAISRRLYAQDLSNFVCQFSKTVYTRSFKLCVSIHEDCVCTRSFKLCVLILENCVCTRSFKLCVSILDGCMHKTFQTLRVDSRRLCMQDIFQTFRVAS